MLVHMKVTLRNQKTGEFFAAGSWVRSPDQAQNFNFSDVAEECRDQIGSPHVDVFYIFRAENGVGLSGN